MGTMIQKFCPINIRTEQLTTEQEEDLNNLTMELLEDWRSNKSTEITIKSVNDLKIRPSTFIRERYCLPHDCYENLGYINNGTYGIIYRVKPNTSQEDRAMKIIKKTAAVINMNEDELFNEIKILKTLDHPNILKTFEFFVDSVNYYVITEFYEEGDLLTKLNQTKFFDERVVANIMRQILSAVAYLHSKHIIHGDLKLDNIVIDSNNEKDSNHQNNFFNNFRHCKSEGNIFYDPKEDRHKHFDIKLIDFGCSKFFTRGDKFLDRVGTSFYIAPEVLQGNYDQLCDIWSCGVIMYILLSGKPPFFGSNDAEIDENIKRGSFSMNDGPFKKVSEDAKNLLRSLLTHDSKRRPTAKNALKHTWFYKEFKTESIEVEYFKSVLNNIKTFNAEIKFQQAVITFITHNLVKKEEIKNLQRIFKYLDKNCDGRISRKELMNAFRDVLGYVMADIELNHIMKAIDHDNSGYIEYEEFLRATIDRNMLLSESNLREAFDLFDIDKNGKISADEIKHIISEGKTIPDQVLVEFYDEIDKKCHEEITYSDFKTIMNKIIV